MIWAQPANLKPMKTTRCATKSLSNDGTLDSENRNIINDENNTTTQTRETYNEATRARQNHNREERVATTTIQANSAQKHVKTRAEIITDKSENGQQCSKKHVARQWTNNTRVEQTARAGTRYIKNERQTTMQTATSTTYQQQHTMKENTRHNKTKQKKNSNEESHRM